MTDDENCQPRSSVVSPKMTIRLAARGAVIDQFDVVVQQSALAASRASPERAPD
jgi:hypothetical protein